MERAHSPPVTEITAPIVFDYGHAESTRPAYDIETRGKWPSSELPSIASNCMVLSFSNAILLTPITFYKLKGLTLGLFMNVFISMFCFTFRDANSFCWETQGTKYFIFMM